MKPLNNPRPTDSENLKAIVLQNNYTNINLQTIRLQLTKVQNHITSQTISSQPITIKESSTKTPMFKPYQISTES